MPFSGTHLHAICMTNCDVCRTCEQDVLVIIHILSTLFWSNTLMLFFNWKYLSDQPHKISQWYLLSTMYQVIKLTGRSCLTWWDDIHKKYQDYQKLKWRLKTMMTPTTFVLFSDASWPLGKYWGHISRYWDFMQHRGPLCLVIYSFGIWLLIIHDKDGHMCLVAW